MDFNKFIRPELRKVFEKHGYKFKIEHWYDCYDGTGHHYYLAFLSPRISDSTAWIKSDEYINIGDELKKIESNYMGYLYAKQNKEEIGKMIGDWFFSYCNFGVDDVKIKDIFLEKL